MQLPDLPLDKVPAHLASHHVATVTVGSPRRVVETRPGALAAAVAAYDAGLCELAQLRLSDDWHAQFAIPRRVVVERLPHQRLALRLGEHGRVYPRTAC
ncbi:hypothetical protein [Azospirillum sp. ST 5-10]|uniref:hypothetical protein n=1 Tax=unclassified Azospirillum TaxID=2630922 RepID=UPI003F4A2D3A